VSGEFFFQKRRAGQRSGLALKRDREHFPSGRAPRESCVAADAPPTSSGESTLGVIDWNPWPVRRQDIDHPDELRVVSTRRPEVGFDEVRASPPACARCSSEHDLLGFPKTSGSRGIHVNVRIEPRHSFGEVRRAALALAREVERRMPGRATSKSVEGGARRRVSFDYN